MFYTCSTNDKNPCNTLNLMLEDFSNNKSIESILDNYFYNIDSSHINNFNKDSLYQNRLMQFKNLIQKDNIISDEIICNIKNENSESWHYVLEYNDEVIFNVLFLKENKNKIFAIFPIKKGNQIIGWY